MFPIVGRVRGVRRFVDMWRPRPLHFKRSPLSIPVQGFAILKRLGKSNSPIMDTPMDIQAWRKVYRNSAEPILLEEALPSRDPFKLFDFCDMRPSSRMVLLKAYSSSGFSFFTNYESRKGRQLAENQNAAMLFYWPKVHRQIRIEGEVSKLPMEQAITYWNLRPLASRIGSKSSLQSSTVPDRQYLEDRRKELEELAERDGELAISKPDQWGGFILKPRYFEFWQGQSDRLHDRIVFEEDGEMWIMKRIAP